MDDLENKEECTMIKAVVKILNSDLYLINQIQNQSSK